MKKILLVVLMLMTFTTFSQESKQIMESYTIAKYYDSDANSTDWNEVDEIRIFFNYSGDENIIKIYMAGGVRIFENISSPKRGETSNGKKYKLYDLSNTIDGTKIKLCYYDNKELGVMIIFENNTALQLSNPE